MEQVFISKTEMAKRLSRETLFLESLFFKWGKILLKFKQYFLMKRKDYYALPPNYRLCLYVQCTWPS